MEVAPWLALWPGLCLTIVVYSLNMLGDALRDLLDPRLRGAAPPPSGAAAVVSALSTPRRRDDASHRRLAGARVSAQQGARHQTSAWTGCTWLEISAPRSRSTVAKSYCPWRSSQKRGLLPK